MHDTTRSSEEFSSLNGFKRQCVSELSVRLQAAGVFLTGHTTSARVEKTKDAHTHRRGHPADMQASGMRAAFGKSAYSMHNSQCHTTRTRRHVAAQDAG
eukprot:1369339-Pleurochrysis_carterae.AAC.5